jgi:hypothetical protein
MKLKLFSKYHFPSSKQSNPELVVNYLVVRYFKELDHFLKLTVIFLSTNLST